MVDETAQYPQCVEDTSERAVTCRRVEVQPRSWNFIAGLIFFLSSLSTSTRIENKNILTWAEIRNTFAMYLTSWFANQNHCYKNM